MEVASDAMLQARGWGCKVESLLRIIPVLAQAVNQPAHEGIASTNTIYDWSDVIRWGRVKISIGALRHLQSLAR